MTMTDSRQNDRLTGAQKDEGLLRNASKQRLFTVGPRQNYPGGKVHGKACRKGMLAEL